MSYRVVVLASAKTEFEVIYEWLRSRSPQGAANWFNSFTEALQGLEENPTSFGFAPENELVERELRQLVFKTKLGNRYRAIFTVEADTVYVLHIRGSGQRLLKVDEL